MRLVDLYSIHFSLMWAMLAAAGTRCDITDVVCYGAALSGACNAAFWLCALLLPTALCVAIPMRQLAFLFFCTVAFLLSLTTFDFVSLLCFMAFSWTKDVIFFLHTVSEKWAWVERPWVLCELVSVGWTFAIMWRLSATLAH